MKAEVSCAAKFIANLMRSGAGSEVLDEDMVEVFAEDLGVLLTEHYRHHWHPERPARGSGYRCLRINHQTDPLIQRAADSAGLGSHVQRLPAELTIWVDPREVSYRIGEDGSVCNLLKKPEPVFQTQTSSVSPMADSWYPTSHSPPTPVANPSPPSHHHHHHHQQQQQQQQHNMHYHSNRTSPVTVIETRRSPPMRRLSATDCWDIPSTPTTSSYSSYSNNHNNYRQTSSFSIPQRSSPPELRHHARSPSPPYRSSRMLRFVAAPVS